MGTCESLVYPRSGSGAGTLTLTPQPIMDTLTQLDAMLKKLESAALDVIKDMENKRQVCVCVCVCACVCNVSL